MFSFCGAQTEVTYLPAASNTTQCPDMTNNDPNANTVSCDGTTVGSICTVTCSDNLVPAGGAQRFCEVLPDGTTGWTGGNDVRCDPPTGYMRMLPNGWPEFGNAPTMATVANDWHLPGTVTVTAYVRHRAGFFGGYQNYFASNELVLYLDRNQDLCIAVMGSVRRSRGGCLVDKIASGIRHERIEVVYKSLRSQ